MLGVCSDRVRRWKHPWEQEETAALWCRPATQTDRKTGRTGTHCPGREHLSPRLRLRFMDPGACWHVVERASEVKLSFSTVWRLLTVPLDWSLKRPQRKAVERDETEIARWVAHELPLIKSGP
ncbi:winged helix-turn-helix domain-containing protein [Nocardiopsis dassonvillei]|uniref:winged helix-turn-helix domain-containing protein n=2 Tax=Nocardiopsis dassonvillei TaxID=2014 RepID=UPI0035E3EA00